MIFGIELALDLCVQRVSRTSCVDRRHKIWSPIENAFISYRALLPTAGVSLSRYMRIDNPAVEQYRWSGADVYARRTEPVIVD